jgi:hypothetical protein
MSVVNGLGFKNGASQHVCLSVLLLRWTDR